MRLIDFPDTIDLAFDKIELLQDGRDEPQFPAAAVADFPEATRLDPARVDVNPETLPPKRSAWRGTIGSLLLHLLPLLALISGLRPPLEMPKPIPVQLVIEQPPPPPPSPPAEPSPRERPPPGPRASDDFGEVGPPSAQKGADATPSTHGEAPPPVAQAQTAPTPPAPEPPAEPPPTAQIQTALTPPEPPAESPPAAQAQTAPSPPGPLVGPPPATRAQTAPSPPEPTVEAAQVMPRPIPPKPTPPSKPTPPKQRMAALPRPLEGLELPLPLHPDRPRQASASARYPGPNATRDEYCVYALKLTMEHVDLLPLSLLGARRGDTAVTIRLREDGTIVNAMVAQGSGYLDIDERVAEMVKAVGRFPPLPLWLPGPTADFTFHMHFPNPAER